MAGPWPGPSTRQWQRNPCHVQWLCSPQWAVWVAEADTALTRTQRHYREGAAELELGDGFFREQSRPARDLSVLLAADQACGVGQERGLRWLDLMAGCGIRSLRWGLEAAGRCAFSPEIWVNDADPDRSAVLKSNMKRLEQKGCPLHLFVQSAERLLTRAWLDGDRFDLIDLDAFGSPSALIQPALMALQPEGVLFLASTDGRSPTGHDRSGAIRRLGAAARVHPASWELALRHQIGFVARQAWMLGHGLEPLLSFSDGRTFRTAVRLLPQHVEAELNSLGLLARCDVCGNQQVQSLLRLRAWEACLCPSGSEHLLIHGPLWLGPLQGLDFLRRLSDASVPVAGATGRLLHRLLADSGSPARVWSTAELASRLGLSGPPSVSALVQALRDAGQLASVSGVMGGQIRTNADLQMLLQLCSAVGGEGP